MSKAKKSLFLKKLFFIFLQSFQFKFKICALLLLSFRLLCRKMLLATMLKLKQQELSQFLLHQLRNLHLSYQVSEIFFKLPNGTKLIHLKAFTFTSFIPVLHIYLIQLQAAGLCLIQNTLLLLGNDLSLSIFPKSVLKNNGRPSIIDRCNSICDCRKTSLNSHHDR